MSADLIILGAGIAGLSAALGACDRGAFPLLLDAGDPPETGRRFDLLIDADFTPVGGPMPTAVSWACTRILGVAGHGEYHRLPGHIVDREALRQQLLTEALGRGATVAWQTPASWDGERASAPTVELPDVPVLLAGSAFVAADMIRERRIRRVWQGHGTPVSSYVPDCIRDAAGHRVLGTVGGNRWACFGWQADGGPAPALPDDARLTWERAYPVVSADQPLSGQAWLRLGGAADLEPRHGFGLAARLALSRSTGWLAAEWALTGEGPEAWAAYGEWLAPYRHWFQTSLETLI